MSPSSLIIDFQPCLYLQSRSHLQSLLFQLCVWVMGPKRFHQGQPLLTAITMTTPHISGLHSDAREGAESCTTALGSRLEFAKLNSYVSKAAGKMEFFHFNFWSLLNSIIFHKEHFRKQSWKRALSNLKKKLSFLSVFSGKN